MQQRIRRVISIAVLAIAAILWLVSQYSSIQTTQAPTGTETPQATRPATGAASDLLDTLAVKGRAPKTDYARAQFGDGWATQDGCDTRNIILNRDLTDVTIDDECHVTKGTLADPYTGKTIAFVRGTDTSGDVQIDHVVALSNAWQTGAQQLTRDRRIELANDPLELLAVDGPANQAKGDGDAATWLPSNKTFRCQYVARQIAVKAKYQLWVTAAEKEAMQRILGTCPGQQLPAA